MTRFTNVLVTSRNRPFAVSVKPFPDAVPLAVGAHLDLVAFPPLQRLGIKLDADRLALDLGEGHRGHLFLDRIHVTPQPVLDGWGSTGPPSPGGRCRRAMRRGAGAVSARHALRQRLRIGLRIACEPVTVSVEPWCEEATLAVGSELDLVLDYREPGWLEIELTGELAIVYAWGGCRAKLFVDGVRRPSRVMRIRPPACPTILPSAAG